ncbi:MAG TPA: hypothetical protein VFV96_15895 [Verrucomicrobiae bacterium]|nr:hypothetical protein [Verrucomicrobiae bacterium]
MQSGSPNISQRLSVVALTAATLFAFWTTAQAAPAASTSRLTLPNHRRYDLAASADVRRLKGDLERMIQDEARFLAQRKAQRQAWREQTPLAEMSRTELRRYFDEPLAAPSNNELRGLRELQSLLDRWEHAPDFGTRTNVARWMVEIAHSLGNLHRTPIPTRVEVTLMPLLFAEYLHRPMVKGTTRAADVPPAGPNADFSRVDPPDSSFWQKPANVAQADLFHCFGRTNWPAYPDLLWEYDAPKTSFGSNPGFTLKHGDLELKAKFGEWHSEPFATRIFNALGYHSEPADFAPFLRVKYDRRLFREFHLRRELGLHFRLLGVVPLGQVSIQKRRDPFQCITEAVLKNGHRLSGTEFKQRLLRDAAREHPEDDPANFDPAFEAQIDYLVTQGANVQLKDDRFHNLGAWDFGGLGHENLRELRGAGLLAAWLGYTDVRFDNTRLKLVRTGDHVTVQHFFSDLGGGLGKGAGVFSWHSDQPNLFAWTCTAPPREQGKGRMTIPFRIVNYRPIDPVPAFANMTWDDARWMARWIGQLSEAQLVAGLIGSGFDAAEVRLLTEKLISRRDQMIQDLRLTGEIPLLRPAGPQRDFDYRPQTGGTMTAVLPDGTRVAARVTDQYIEHGRIVTPVKLP